jgi:hypothetical protein
MDDLERQMEHLRKQMQRTLSGAEGSGRLTVLDRFRSIFPGRSAPRDTGGSSNDARDSAEGLGPTPTEAGGGAQEATGAPEEEPGRGFFSRLFRG